MSTDRFDAAAATWDEAPRRVKLTADVSAAIREACGLPADLHVLDFGCGTGLLTLALRPLVRTVTGADTSTGMLDVLEGKVRAGGLSGVSTVRLTPGEPLALGRRYDLIVSSMALHHIEELAPLLEALRAHVQPGGRVALADLDREDGSFHEDPTGVFHRGFDRDHVVALLSAAGFADVAVTTAAVTSKEGRDYPIFLATGRSEG